MSVCDSLGCKEGCCDYYNGKPYCLISSQCKSNPLWESIVIPAVLFALAVVLILVVCYKLRTKGKAPMQVTNFARQEMYFVFYAAASNLNCPMEDFRRSPPFIDRVPSFACHLQTAFPPAAVSTLCRPTG
jgi:hypothetical protein